MHANNETLNHYESVINENFKLQILQTKDWFRRNKINNDDQNMHARSSSQNDHKY
jgi:Zn-finger domain-containing protein